MRSGRWSMVMVVAWYHNVWGNGRGLVISRCWNEAFHMRGVMVVAVQLEAPQWVFRVKECSGSDGSCRSYGHRLFGVMVVALYQLECSESSSGSSKWRMKAFYGHVGPELEAPNFPNDAPPPLPPPAQPPRSVNIPPESGQIIGEWKDIFCTNNRMEWRSIWCKSWSK
jgi:hypothetical protein